ncbi:hypothetical protein AB205_0011820 [Aquarana catesbeiana]|uniref:Uncharacterized protein n=1 Tax=Aquarana catesbeiana TaxID=8400 RepID=A0A2G9S2W5_AQUCT|nr:hypothetical protein AB205_0011820 [Aquarana catesbeiana]
MVVVIYYFLLRGATEDAGANEKATGTASAYWDCSVTKHSTASEIASQKHEDNSSKTPPKSQCSTLKERNFKPMQESSTFAAQLVGPSTSCMKNQDTAKRKLPMSENNSPPQKKIPISSQAGKPVDKTSPAAVASSQPAPSRPPSSQQVSVEKFSGLRLRYKSGSGIMVLIWFFSTTNLFSLKWRNTTPPYVPTYVFYVTTFRTIGFSDNFVRPCVCKTSLSQHPSEKIHGFCCRNVRSMSDRVYRA